MLIYVSAFLNIISKQLTIRILDQIQLADYVINSLRISSDATSESSLWNDFILLPFVLEISESLSHLVSLHFSTPAIMGIIGRLRHSSWLSGADSPAGKMPQVQRQRQILTASRGRQRKLTDSEAGNSGSLSNKSVQSRALGPRCKKSSVAPLWCRRAIPLYRKLQSPGMKTRSCSAS